MSIADANGYYIYGITIYGITSNTNSPTIEELPTEGIDPAHPVYALPYQDVQAIVSRVSLEEFGEQALIINLQDPRWLEAKVRAHENILEEVLTKRTLIPMRFCTIFWVESSVQEMLVRCHDEFVNALARLKDKREWGVKAYSDGTVLAQRIRETSDKVRKLETKTQKESGGAAYFGNKILEKTISEEAERITDECAQCTHDCLSEYAEEVVISPLQSKEITGRTDEMILNGAYFVAEESLQVFRDKLAGIQQEYGDFGFSYQMTGPWPPYNFVSMNDGGSG